VIDVDGERVEAGRAHYQHATAQRDREFAAYIDSAITDSTDQHRRV
jgi:hypothetical protein